MSGTKNATFTRKSKGGTKLSPCGSPYRVGGLEDDLMPPPAGPPVERGGLGEQSQQARHGPAPGTVLGGDGHVQGRVRGPQQRRRPPQPLPVGGGG